MTIKRIEYKSDTTVVKEYKKIVLEELDEHHYMRKIFIKNNTSDSPEWYDGVETSYFNSEKVCNGTVHYTGDVVKNLFNYKIKYEGYSLVTPN